ncbi:MAG: hypothetical protein HOE90_14855 [Bacteriovoracaceae bacterium]|jgi:hypothetical protein|nr:hypothetical protein [Bacteriovoracaceae bacterium]
MEDTDLIYRGSFNYINDGVSYTQENFEIFHSESSGGLLLKSETLSRASTGDFLKINIQYLVNKKFLPVNVKVEKNLGTLKVTETYISQYKEQSINYHFQNDRGQDIKKVIATPSNYQIATPSVCFSLMFTKSRKPDLNVRTRYILLSSENTWEYVKPIQSLEVYVESPTTKTATINLGDNDLTANVFHLYQHDAGDTKHRDEKPVIYYLSDHLCIPYLVEDPSGLKIEVKSLNDLTANRVKNL